MNITEEREYDDSKTIGSDEDRINTSIGGSFSKRLFNGVTNKIIEDSIRTGQNFARNMISQKFGSFTYFYNFDSINYMAALKWIFNKNKSKYIQNVKRSYIGGSKDIPPLESCSYYLQLDKGTFMHVCSRKDDEKSARGGYTILSMYIFGKKYKYYMNDLLRTIKTQNKVSNKITVINMNKDYYRTSTIDRRGFDTIFIDKKTKNEIVSFINKWSRNSSIFKERGIPYKTGILLHGVRGTGKSTIARAIASELNAAIIPLSMSSLELLNMGSLTDAMTDFSDRTVVILLEDIDCLVDNREDTTKETSEKKQAIFHDLLQLLDGINSGNNIVFVATTNYIDRLDTALTRDSRFDLKPEIKELDRSLAEEMCRSFNISPEEVLKDDEMIINPSSLQTRIIKHTMK